MNVHSHLLMMFTEQMDQYCFIFAKFVAVYNLLDSSLVAIASKPAKHLAG